MVQPKQNKYPCGKCHKECIEVTLMKRAKFEDHSVCCDKCDVWYHLVCLGLKGNEPEIVKGSTLPYFCHSCTVTQEASDDTTAQSVNECEPSTSHGEEHVPKSTKGKGRKKINKKYTIIFKYHYPKPSVTAKCK